MSSFDLTICDVEDFVAEVTAQAGSLEEAASTQEILSQQIEGFLSRLRSSVCLDLTNLQAQLDACDCSGGGGGGGLPDLEQGVEILSGRQVEATGVLEDSYFMLVDLGAMPVATSKNVAHGITGTFTPISIYGAATDPALPATLPLPFVNSALITTQIMIYILGANIVVDSGSVDRSLFSDSYLVIEYVKS